MSGDEGTGDRLAAAVTADWQSAVLSSFPGRFVAEQPVGQLRERIDLVDLVGGIAYNGARHALMRYCRVFPGGRLLPSNFGART